MNDSPIFYRYLQLKFFDTIKENNFKKIYFEDLFNFFGQYRIPEKLRNSIIDEMQNMKLITINRNDKYIILNVEIKRTSLSGTNKTIKSKIISAVLN